VPKKAYDKSIIGEHVMHQCIVLPYEDSEEVKKAAQLIAELVKQGLTFKAVTGMVENRFSMTIELTGGY
jgi:hypothetical protein